MTPDMNRAQRSTLHSAMLRALGQPTEFVEDDESYRMQAWCEIIAWADCPEDVLALANHIADFIAEHDYVEVDSSQLCEARQNINWAMRLNGIRPRPSGHVQTLWTNAPQGLAGDRVTLPESFA